MYPRHLALAVLALAAHSIAVELPGKKDDGSVLLPNQWKLRPAGEQIALGDFPVNLALHPAGKYAAALHCGFGQHEVVIIDLAARTIASREKVEEAFYGVAFSADGKQLFCSGSAGEVVHRFAFANGALSEHSFTQLRDAKIRGIPAGIAIDKACSTVWAANLWGHSVSRISLIADSALPKEIHLSEKSAAPAPAQPATTDDPSITKRDAQLLEATAEPAPFPYACVLDEKRSRLYVSLWGEAAVAVIDTKTDAIVGRWKVEEHPNEMVLSKDGRRLYVANANRNTVSVLDPATGAMLETLLAELRPNSPPGNTPNSVALSPDGARLYVANANINTVAVFDVSTAGKARSLGFIPVGWYPTSVRVSTDGRTLYVLNGKGELSKPNPLGPQPGQKTPVGVNQYIGQLMNGTLSIIPLPAAAKAEAQLKQWTAQAYSCMPDEPSRLSSEVLADNPIPRKIGDPTPLKYVIYIVKENRTYDQVLGDLKGGNGDPSLCLFPEAVTPNHHALAREFVLLDNFYVDAEVSADGHEWSMGAYATDFVEKTWPMSYGHGKSKKWPFPAEGGFPIAAPAGGYLWDRAKAAGVTYRSYGEWIANSSKIGEPARAKVKALEGHFDPFYRGFDMGYSDQKRADRFLAEVKRFESEDEMPRLQIVRVGNDHTSGTSPGKPTPTAHVADNDLAVGRIIDGLSRSKFWPQLAVFIIEDDAQNGPDHVDAHRTIAYAISPYIKRGSVDSSMYSTTSMVRTIGLILGMQPMSQFDAAALPMFASFQPKPDLTPYTARPVDYNLEEKNSKTAWGGQASQRMNFAKEDAADDLQLNEVIWRSVRGANSPMPAPRRAAFVFTQKERKDDDD